MKQFWEHKGEENILFVTYEDLHKVCEFWIFYACSPLVSFCLFLSMAMPVKHIPFQRWMAEFSKPDLDVHVCCSGCMCL